MCTPAERGYRREVAMIQNVEGAEAREGDNDRPIEALARTLADELASVRERRAA
jgi:hypothetical protein